MDECCPEQDVYGSQPCTPQTFNPMMPSTSRVSTPARPSSTMSARQHGSPFRPQPMNMEPSNSRVQELRDAAVGKRSYTSDWMQGSYVPPNHQSQQIQRAPSMIGSTMSTMSQMSQMSQMTTFSALSVNTECGQFDNWIYQSQPALYKVSSMENQDPMKKRERMSVVEICENLRSTQLNVQRTSIQVLEPIAKARNLESNYGAQDLQQIIEALFEILVPRPEETDNVIRKACEILVQAILALSRERIIDKAIFQLNEKLMKGITQFDVPKPYSVYELVMTRALQLDAVYESNAMVLLTHLCCKRYLKKRVFQNERPSEAYRRVQLVVTNFVIQNLQRPETKTKNKGFLVSIIKNLWSKNPVMRQMARSLGVIKIFYTIIKDEYSDEDLIWATMRALTELCSDMNNGEAFVELGGAQVLCSLLSHPSTRLLHELLNCMKKLSDLPAIQKQDMKESIHNIIKLIGCDDPIIVESAAGTLRNIGFHNKINKVYMVQSGVTSHVLAVLRTAERFNTYFLERQMNPIQGHNIQRSICESCLSILNNVVMMSQNDNKESALHACRMISENTDSAYILLQLFNVGDIKFRKMTVAILKRVIETVPAYAEHFIELRSTSGFPLPFLLLTRAHESLVEWHKLMAALLNWRSEGDSRERREYDDSRKDHEDIAKRSIGLLSYLSDLPDTRFFQMMIDGLRSRNFSNPLRWIKNLRKELPDNILLETLRFIRSITSKEWSMNNLFLLELMHKEAVTIENFQEIYNQRQQNPEIQESCHLINQIYAQQQQYFQQRQQQEQQHQMLMAQQHQH